MNRPLPFHRHATDHELFPGSCTPRGACCLRCGGTLHEGFLVDPPQQFEPASATVWHPGGKEAHAWTGAPLETSKQRRVVARRCDGCGALELFAP